MMKLPSVVNLKERPWQHLYFVVMLTLDVLMGAALLTLVFASGGISCSLLLSFFFRLSVLLCLIFTRRAGFFMAFLAPPNLPEILARTYLQGNTCYLFAPVYCVFHYYCMFSRANRRYCFPPRDDAFPSTGDGAGDAFCELSNRLNRYHGMRTNVTLDVIAGPSPAGLMPTPLERDWDGIEQPDPPDDDAPGNDAPLPAAEAAAQQRFAAHQPLEPLHFSLLLHSQNLLETDGDTLLAACDAYAFLKDERRVRLLFSRACAQALSDLRGYEAPPRTGIGAGDDLLHKSEMRVIVTLTENPLPLGNTVSAQFYVNC